MMIDTHHGADGARTADEFRREQPGIGKDGFAANGGAWMYRKDFLDRVRGAGFAPVEIEPFPDAPARFCAASGPKPYVRAPFAFRCPGGLRRFFGHGEDTCPRTRPNAGPAG